MAAHESPRTAKLYDRTGDEITLDEVERICDLTNFVGLPHLDICETRKSVAAFADDN